MASRTELQFLIFSLLCLSVVVTGGRMPHFENKPTTVTVLEGVDATLTCDVQRIDNVAVRWYRENTPLALDNSHVTVTMDTTKGHIHLHISHVTSRDSGVYYCVGNQFLQRIELNVLSSVPRKARFVDSYRPPGRRPPHPPITDYEWGRFD